MRAAGKQQETVAGDSRLLENFDKASMKPSFVFIEFPHHAPKQDDLRNRVYRFYSDNIQAGRLYTRNHFMAEGVSKSTINAILQRFHNNLPASHKVGGGRPAKIFTPRKIRSKEPFLVFSLVEFQPNLFFAHLSSRNFGLSSNLFPAFPEFGGFLKGTVCPRSLFFGLWQL
ncbi:hypothetical protein DdX_21157 [Ditylenchus destructor]|uniref:Uncharacterized protein n=1 Tax=Ditylenchus destructor TaxID=166010 RepID=A0AAD4MG50_9BILA|nr:hypothetical protein DdX_21157 [Ditylenchus destructor]